MELVRGVMALSRRAEDAASAGFKRSTINRPRVRISTLPAILILVGAAVPSIASAQSALAPTGPSPWSLPDTVGAPDNLKLRASVRTRIESIAGQARPGLNANDTLLDLRTTLFAEYQTGPLRFGAEIFDSRAYGGDLKTPIGTNDVNVAELVQAYVAIDLVEPLGKGSKAKLQVGRIALNAGSRRLVSSEDWRNTTNSYRGLRGDMVLPKGLSATAFYVQPTIRLPDDKPNLLDNAYRTDRESSTVTLWGGLATKTNLVAKTNAELSYYHFEEKDSVGRPTRDRSLDTAGGRLYREPALGHADFEIEAFQQSGEISRTLLSNATPQPVSAQFFHTDLGYSFATAWKPRVSVRYDFISGDRGGSHYGRFDTLYGMRGAELAQSGLYNTVGRANLISPGLFLELTPNRQNDLYIRYRPLWLASRTDSFSTSNVRDISGRSGSFAGNQVELRWRRWLIVDALRFEVNGVYLAKGRFLREAPNSAHTPDTKYGAFNLTSYF